jgi:PAS domain S-box-containing protein
VVVALLDPAYFEESFRRINLGKDNSVSLLRADGFLLTRYPLREEWMGKDMRGFDVFREILSHRDRGVVHTDTSLDNVPRIVSTMKLKEFPLAVNVSITREEALRKWRVNAAQLGVGALLGSLIAITLLYLLGRQIRRQELTGRRLRESEERLRLALDGATDGVWDWNLATGQAYFSPRWYTMLGYAPDEFPASYESWRGLLHPDDAAATEGAVGARLTGDGSFALEFRMREKNGGWRWILGRGMVVERDRNGGALRMAGSHSDIADRKAAEEALRQSQATLQSIFRSAPTGIGLVRNRIFVWTNAKMQEITGYSGEELTGSSARMVYPSDQEFEHVGREKYAQIRAHGTGTVETRLRRKDGRIIDVLMSSTPLDPDDLSAGVTFTALDITESKRAEAAREANLRRLNALLDNIPDSAWLKDRDSRFIAVNEAYGRLAGRAPEALVGMSERDIWPEDVAGRFIADDTEVMETRRRKQVEERLVLTDGGEVWYETIKSPIFDEAGAVAGTAGIARDITERKQREAELQAKTDELMRFTYTVSHDLKSPLVTIRTFLGFLEQDLEKRDAERIATDMDFMRNASEKMARLLEELLELSRIGRMVTTPVQASLQDLVREARDLVAGRLAERGVSLRITDAPVLVRGDRPRLVEVFQNLIDNAVKFMGDQPEPMIEIGSEEREEELVLVVRDNGVGIDPRHIHKIFGLFEKLDPDAEGTGIGLTLVKRIVEAHGGNIWVESPGPGKGATFRFTLAGTQYTPHNEE